MKRIFLTLFLLLFSLTGINRVEAQDTDYGSWVSFEASWEIFNNFDLEFEEEIRIFKKLNEIQRFSTSLGGVYSLNKQLKTGFGYAWLYRHDVNDNFWVNKHRYYLYITGKVIVGRLKFSLRERFQSTYYDQEVKRFDYSPRNYLRSRLQAAWDLKNCRAEPYVSAEMHYSLNNPDGNEISNMRYTLGVDFPLNKRLDLDLFFRLDQEKNVKKQDQLWLLGIAFELEL